MEANEEIEGFWDREGLRRIFENCLKNAHKYGSPHSPITTRLSKSDGRAEIAIHNWGNPIPEQDQKELFNPFHRSRSAQIGQQRGWGLGLTLVRGMAEAHGGKVTLSSSAEMGTTFLIELPVNHQ